MATRKPTQGSKVAASRAQAEQERLARQIVALEAKLERDRKRSRLGRTQRQLRWVRDLARAQEQLRLAARATDPAKRKQHLEKASELEQAVKRALDAPTENMIERAATINAWRRDLSKKTPSRQLIEWCEFFGRWCPMADGTATGEAHFEVPREARRSYAAFRQWFVGLKREFLWLADEPVWFTIGFTVGGSMLYSSSERQRYDRIQGLTGTLSYWTPSVGMPQVHKKRPNRGWELLAFGWIKEPTPNARRIKDRPPGTAWNVFNKPGEELSIKTVSIFVHYGPTAPLREGEFDCEKPTPPSKMGPTLPEQPPVVPAKPTKPVKPAKPTKPKKPAKAPKKPKVVRMFVVYDDNGRRYAQKKAYSGNVPNLWGPLKTAYFFETRKQAQSAASNLNASRPARSRYRAVVWPVDVTLT